MITLKAPSISKSQRTDLERHKLQVEAAIEAAAQETSAVLELSNKAASLERKAAGLRRRANAFELAAEGELVSVEKQLQRVRVAMQDAEFNANVGKPDFARAINAAQETIASICSKTSYESLLDLIAEATAPFYSDYARARYDARNAPAVNALVGDLLSQKIIGTEGIERLNDVARETLARVDALLDGSEIWSFPGCEPQAEVKKAA
jgi:hypothetical protein